MKHRARGRLIVSWGGGYICNEHGIHWTWGNVTRPEYLAILDGIEDHEIIEHDDYGQVDDGEGRELDL
jgi:hypothetical protein